MDIDMDAESVISSSAGGTPAPSVYSYDSSRDGAALLRSVEGRIFNSQNELYFLPADEGEFSRLDKQHLMLLMALGGLYAAKEQVQEALASRPGEVKRILDLGTGGGNWAIGIAQEFPSAQVVGVDLAPSTTRPPPPNCRFEFDDFTLGIPHYYDSFDVVHARSTANGVKDFEWFICEAAKCLKPGGVLLITEGDFEIQNSDKEPQEIAFGEGAPGQSWMARMLFEAYSTMKLRGSSMDAGVMLRPWMERCPEIVDVGTEDFWLPIGPWERGSNPEETRQRENLGTLMRQNSLEFVRALKPMFVSEGYPPAVIDRFIEGTDKELAELSVHMYARWHYAWGRRIGSLAPAPSLDPAPQPAGRDAEALAPIKLITVHDSELPLQSDCDDLAAKDGDMDAESSSGSHSSGSAETLTEVCAVNCYGSS